MSGRGGVLANRMLSTPRPSSERTGPDPTFLEGMSASFRLGQADRVGDDEQEVVNAYSPLVEALTERGMPLTRYVHAARGAGHPVNEERVWEDIAQFRAREPGAFAGVAANQEGFRAQVMERYKARLAQDTDTTSRSGIVPTLVGGVGAAMTDPVNLGLTILTGGGGGAGRTAAQTILREVVLNAGIEAAQQPLVAGQRARTDRTLTAGEAAANVALGGIAGGALKGMELGVRAGVPAGVERTIAGVWDYLPERVRQRWADRATVADADLPELAELTIGRENLTETETAAAGLARRQAEIDAVSPFVRNGAGDAMHRQRIGDAVSAILADIPARPAPARAMPTPAAPLRDSGTAIGSGTIAPRLPRETVKAMIGRAESPNDFARNPKSTATGRYQFTRGTFVAYHRRVFGGDMSDAARWAQATDGAVQERLMDALLADNATFLRRQGEAETAGNLYLVHFAGQSGAKRILDADPATPVARLLDADAISANSFLRGKTAGDVIAWAHSRMGGPTPARAGARAELAGGAGEQSVRARLQAEIDTLQAQALASERDAPAIPDVVDAIAERSPAAREEPAIETMPVEPIARAEQVPPAEPDAALARAAERQTADAPAEDTILPAPIEQAVIEPLVRAPKKRTPVVRKRPSDVVEYLADRGGIRDDEGHDLRVGRDMGRVFVPRAGPLIRKNGGHSIDEAGELLWEAGFFIDRPTEAEVLDVLDRAVGQGEKIYQLHEQTDMDARALDAEQREQIDAAIAGLPEDFPLHPERDREAILDVIEEMHETGADALDALARVIEQRVENARARAYEDAGDVDFEPIGPDLDSDPLRSFADAGQDGGASAAVRGTANGSGGPGALEPLGRGEAPELSEAHARAFDDPDGDAAQAQVDSAEHDLRMAAEPVDPAIAERQRQQAGLKAASPLQAATDQEGTIGLGLFDATDQERFRFDDGQEGTLGELFQDLDGEAADIDMLRACLPPKKGNDA